MADGQHTASSTLPSWTRHRRRTDMHRDAPDDGDAAATEDDADDAEECAPSRGEDDEEEEEKDTEEEEMEVAEATDGADVGFTSPTLVPPATACLPLATRRDPSSEASSSARSSTLSGRASPVDSVSCPQNPPALPLPLLLPRLVVLTAPPPPALLPATAAAPAPGATADRRRSGGVVVELAVTCTSIDCETDEEEDGVSDADDEAVREEDEDDDEECRGRDEIEEAEEGVDITAGALDAEEETLERCRWWR